VNRTLGTLAAVVALTLAACGSGTSDTTTTIPTTTTTADTRGWSDEAFRDLMTYCQATGAFGTCAFFIISHRDAFQCSVEATYRVMDQLDGIDSDDERPAARDELMRDVLQPAGDCLGYDLLPLPTFPPPTFLPDDE